MRNVRVIGSWLALLYITVGAARVARAQADDAPFSGIMGIGMPRSTGYAGPSGSAIEALPIELAQGRKRFQPSLTMVYSSSGGTGELGLGWGIEVGRIQRSPSHGIPTGSQIDEFIFSLAGSGEVLLPIGGGAYRPRLESVFRQYNLVGDHWEVLDGAGTRYTFGASPSNRIDGIVWLLEKAQDTNGNLVTVSYTQDGGHFYTSEIKYTGHAPSHDAGSNRVVYEYEDRPDKTIIFSIGSEQRRQKRLHRISNYAGSQLVRRYEIKYTESGSTHRSLVEAISLIGADDAARVDTRRYQYQVGAFGFDANVLGTSFPVNFRTDTGGDTGARSADVNGDGFVDVVDNGSHVWLGDGAGHFNLDSGWSASLVAAGVTFVDGNHLDTGARLMDVNGDLRPDLLVAPAPKTNAPRRVLLNTGSGWDGTSAASLAYQGSLAALHEQGTTQAQFLDGGPSCPDGGDASACMQLVPYNVNFSLVQDSGDSTGASFADVNGDGLVDIVWSFEITSALVNFPVPDGGPFGGTTVSRVPVRILAVHLNNGAGWTKNDPYSTSLGTLPPFVIDTQIKGFDVLDVNGDGAADIVNSAEPGSVDPRAVWLSTGTGWVQNADYTNSLRATQIVSLASSKSQGLLPADINHDGLLDYVRADESVQIAYRNTGLGWVEDSQASQVIVDFGVRFADGDGVPSGFDFIDVDGDTLSELIFTRDGQTGFIRHATGPIPDLLSHVTSGLGEQTTLQYTPSARFDNHGSDGLAHLPATLQVVTRLTRDDGRGNTFTSTVSYQGGLFALGSRVGEAARFRSFASSSTVDSRGVLTVRRFAQSEELAGGVTSNEVYDLGGALRSRKTVAYLTPAVPPSTTQIQLSQTDEETIDPGGSLHTRLRYSYDEHLNVTRLDKDGDIAVTGDEGHTAFSYAKNLGAGIVSMLATTTVTGPTGALHSRSTLLYDGSENEGVVSKGNATKIVDLVRVGSPLLRTKKTDYDKFGNPVRVVDPRGGITTFAYDDTDTYRERVTDALRRTSRSKFDRRFGRSVHDTDPNGNDTTRRFDAFGRMTVETLPGDGCSPNGTRTWSYSAVGDATAQFVKVSSTETPGRPDTFDTQMFFDGFGASYRVEAEGTAGRRNVVTVEFDDAGARREVSQPFFEGDPVAKNVYERDALRRMVRVTDARGAVTNRVYRGKAIDEIDARGNKTTIVSDAYGNLAEVHQFTGGRELVTTHTYDVVGAPIKIRDPAGEVTTIEYDALGDKTKLVDPNMGTFKYEYDLASNLIKQISPTGTFTFQYDANSEPVKKRLPNGQEIRFTYGESDVNGVGRVTHIDDGAGTVDFRYDPRGNVAEKRRTLDHRTYLTAFSRDSMGRPRRITYPDGFEVQYKYNAGAQVDSIVDGQGQPIVSRLEYNASGEITKAAFANGVSSAYTFDAAGLMKTADTANTRGDALQKLTMVYDIGRNVTSIVDRRRSSHSQSFAYDEINRITAATGSYGSESYQYDEIGNFIHKANLAFARDPAHPQQLRCALDLGLASAASNGIKNDPRLAACLNALLDPTSGLSDEDRAALTRIRQRGSSHSSQIGESLALAYDAIGDLTTRGRTTLDYDPESRLLRVKDGHDVKEENKYGSDGQRVIRTSDKSETTFIDDLYEEERPDYGDGTTRRHVRLGRTIIASVVKQLSKVHLIHDASNDLLSVCNEHSAFSDYSDPAADAASSDPAGTCGIAPHQKHFNWTFSFLMVLVAIGTILVRRPGRGRTPPWTRALLRELRAGGAVCKQTARRLRRRPWFGIFSIFLLVIQAAQLPQSATAHATTSAPQFDDHKDDDQRFYYHLDHIGNTNVVTDSRGAEFERREYRPFGEQSTRTGSTNLEISLNGHHFDAATGFYYFGARHYDPVLGRFLTADTQIPDRSPQSLHRYEFNKNNPLRFVDATGHDFWDVLEDIGVGILVAVGIAAGILLIVVTGGGATPLVALAIGAAAGALIGASIAFGIGFILYRTGAISFGEVLEITLAGAIIGAAIGATIGVGVAGGFAAGASNATVIASDTALGAATGSVGSGTAALVHGASPDQFLEAVYKGAVSGAISGAVSGAITVYGPSVLSWANYPKWIVDQAASRGLSSLVILGVDNFAKGYISSAERLGKDDWFAKTLRFAEDVYTVVKVAGGAALLGYGLYINIPWPNMNVAPNTN